MLTNLFANPIAKLVFWVLVCGAIVWGIDQLPINESFRKVARVIIIVAIVIYALVVFAQMLGVMH